MEQEVLVLQAGFTLMPLPHKFILQKDLEEMPLNMNSIFKAVVFRLILEAEQLHLRQNLQQLQ